MYSSSSSPVEDLLKNLYQYRELIQNLYNHRLPIHINILMGSFGIDVNKINQLVIKEILIKNGDNISLNDLIIEFLDEVFGINQQIQNIKIEDKIDEITKNIQYYFNEDNNFNKKKYLDLIKIQLNSLGKVTRRTIIDLSKRLQNDYKTEINFKNKKLKIEDHNQKAEKLKELIEQIYKIFNDKFFFYEAEDEELQTIKFNLQDDLAFTNYNLIHFHTEIISFIHKIEFQSRVFKKIQHLKTLKDNYEIQIDVNSNLVQLLADNNDMFFQASLRLTTPPNLDYLQTDEGYQLINELKRDYKQSVLKKLKPINNLKISDLQNQTQNEIRINLLHLKQNFFKSEEDLFTFLIQFPYKINLNEADKLRLFCKMVLMYEAELLFTNESLKWKNYNFTLIYPKK